MNDVMRKHYMSEAQWWQRVAAIDFAAYTAAMDRGDLQDAIVWQDFAAQSGATARRFLGRLEARP